MQSSTPRLRSQRKDVTAAEIIRMFRAKCREQWSQLSHAFRTLDSDHSGKRAPSLHCSLISP